MNSHTLAGLGVLVTRPAGQCDALCGLVRQAGGDAVPWPALDILPAAPDPSSLARLDSAGPDDVAIFVSRNAVSHGARRLPGDRRLRLTAVGPSTFRALEDAGFEPDVVPSGFNSESLLQSPELRDMTGRTVFIFRGQGGRELLASELSRRGARIEYVEVYLRRPRRPEESDSRRLLARWHDGGIGIYTATSVEILDAIRNGLGPAFSTLLATTPLVTASRRVVQRSEESGHRAERVLAPAPDDASLVGSIARWWSRIGTGPRPKKE